MRVLDRIAYGQSESEDRRTNYNQSEKSKTVRSMEGTVWVPKYVLGNLPPKASMKREFLKKLLNEQLSTFRIEDIDKSPLPKDRISVYIQKEQILKYNKLGKELGVRGSLIIRSILINLGKKV